LKTREKANILPQNQPLKPPTNHLQKGDTAMKKIEFMLAQPELEEMFLQEQQTYEEVENDTITIGDKQYHQETIFDVIRESSESLDPSEPETLSIPQDIPWTSHDDIMSSPEEDKGSAPPLED
jgi:hypothetical protein